MPPVFFLCFIENAYINCLQSTKYGLDVIYVRNIFPNYLIGIAVISLSYTAVLLSEPTFLNLTKEDGIIEGMGAVLFLISAIMSAILFYKTLLRPKNLQLGRPLFYVFFALAFLFSFGEEISWGQRILGFNTPSFIEEKNLQGEFNVHNLKFFHGVTEDGNPKFGLWAWLTMKRLLILFCIGYLVILPIVVFISEPARRIIGLVDLPIPHIFPGVIFLYTVILAKIIKFFIESPDLRHGIVEIMETNIAFVWLYVPVSWWIKYWKSNPSP